MNYLAWSGILISISSLLCSTAVFMNRPTTVLKSTWGFFSLAVSLWGFGLYKAYTTVDYHDALFWLRFLNLSAITIPVLFVHFVILFTDSVKKRICEIVFYYGILIAVVIISLLKPDLFIPNLSPKAGFDFYPNPGFIYYCFFSIFVFLANYGLYLLFKSMQKASANRRIQARYILLGTTVGFLGGSTTFFPVFNIAIFPFGASFVVLYVFSVTYAVVKYRLMDIRVAISSAGIFLAVYALTLGIPFYFYTKGSHLRSLIFAIVLATGAPVICSRLQRRAAETLLEKERATHDILLKAAQKLTQEKTVESVCQFLMSLLTRVFMVRGAAHGGCDSGRASQRAARGVGHCACFGQYPCVDPIEV